MKLGEGFDGFRASTHRPVYTERRAMPFPTERLPGRCPTGRAAGRFKTANFFFRCLVPFPGLREEPRSSLERRSFFRTGHEEKARRLKFDGRRKQPGL